MSNVAIRAKYKNMKSKIRVEFDFDNKQPFIQVSLAENNEPGTENDMRDQMLKNFIETVKETGIEVMFPSKNNNPIIELRPMFDTTVLNLAGESIKTKLTTSMYEAFWESISGAMWASDGTEREALDVMKGYITGLVNSDRFKITDEQREFINGFFDWVKTPTKYPLMNAFSQPVPTEVTDFD